MSLPTTSFDDLIRHLCLLGLDTQPNVVVHSRLLSFGLIEGRAAGVYNALRQVVGDGGTIAVPTYTLGLGEDRPYDPLVSESMEVGALSEYVRRLPGAVRSLCPLHNHAAVGPAAGVLSQVAGTVSLGPSSDFEAMRKADFSLLLLGCGFHEGATFVHHMEAMVGVPYRKWLDLSRTVVVDGSPQLFPVRYYGRASTEWIEDFDRVRVGMETRNLLRAVDCPMGRSYLMRLSDLDRYLDTLLRTDPYAVVGPAKADAHA